MANAPSRCATEVRPAKPGALQTKTCEEGPHALASSATEFCDFPKSRSKHLSKLLFAYLFLQSAFAVSRACPNVELGPPRWGQGACEGRV